MNCIIIDDEPLAIEILISYCKDLEFLNLVGSFTNALDALSLLQSQHIDLIFTDIEMPQITGIDFINSIDHKPLFIFTTAYPEYALKGFELNAVDYLVKPIRFNRFLKAVNRARQLIDSNKTSSLIHANPEKDNTSEFIFVKADYGQIKIIVNDLTYIEGMKDYLKIYVSTSEKPILTLMNFSSILKKLPNNKFLRVHKSYVVNIDQITGVQRKRIFIEDIKIPIGEVYRQEVLKVLNLD